MRVIKWGIHGNALNTGLTRDEGKSVHQYSSPLQGQLSFFIDIFYIS